MSLLCGAGQRLAPVARGGFLGRRLCYTQTVQVSAWPHQARRNLHLLSAWGIAATGSLQTEIRAAPALAGLAAGLLPRPVILCHLAASQPKKEWPLAHWAGFYRQATTAGFELMFCTGTAPREQMLLAEFKKLAPDAPALPILSELHTFLAVLKRARLFISGDTGPLHFAGPAGAFPPSLFSVHRLPTFGRRSANSTGRCKVAVAVATTDILGLPECQPVHGGDFAGNRAGLIATSRCGVRHDAGVAVDLRVIQEFHPDRRCESSRGRCGRCCRRGAEAGSRRKRTPTAKRCWAGRTRSHIGPGRKDRSRENLPRPTDNPGNSSRASELVTANKKRTLRAANCPAISRIQAAYREAGKK